jgi:repressor LexA
MTKRLPLTRRQQALYDYLCEHQAQFDQPLSLDKLCEALELRSRDSLHKHIKALINAGLVEPMNHKQRGVRIKQPLEQAESGLPFLGYISAGQPIEAIETQEYIEVPPHLYTARTCFVLQVRGDSMSEEGILNGDWVIVEQRDWARNGEIVVALIDGREATLKRFSSNATEIILAAANSAIEPMRYVPDRIMIQGVVVAQMRAYR